MRIRYSKRKTVKQFTNGGDPEQTPVSATSDPGLNCLLFIYPFWDVQIKMGLSDIRSFTG